MLYQRLGGVPHTRLFHRIVNATRRPVVLQLLFGLLIGFVLGSLWTQEAVEDDLRSRVQQAIQHSEVPRNVSSLFIRCVIVIHPDTQKAEKFVRTVAEFHAKKCNHSVFFTTSADLQLKMKEEVKLILVDSWLNLFYWSFYRQILAYVERLEPRAHFTFFSDEQTFVVMENLRHLLAGFDPESSLLLARVSAPSTFLSLLFPFSSREAVGMQGGMAMSAPALRRLASPLCSKRWTFHAATQSALLDCAVAQGVSLVDPVDEEGMRLLHDKALIALVPVVAQQGQSRFSRKADCCSDHAVSFGQMSYKEQRTAYYAVQNLTTFGVALRFD